MVLKFGLIAQRARVKCRVHCVYRRYGMCLLQCRNHVVEYMRLLSSTSLTLLRTADRLHAQRSRSISQTALGYTAVRPERGVAHGDCR